MPPYWVAYVVTVALLGGFFLGRAYEARRARRPRDKVMAPSYGQMMSDAVGQPQPETFEQRIIREVTQWSGRVDQAKEAINLLAGQMGLEFQHTKPEKSRLVLVPRPKSDGGPTGAAPPPDSPIRGAFS